MPADPYVREYRTKRLIEVCRKFGAERVVFKDFYRHHPKKTEVTPIRRLYDLQLLDSRHARLKAMLAGLDDGSALRAQVEQARTDEQALRADLQARQGRLLALELELQSTAEKATKMERDLYSGRISNPKELTAMQQDIQALGRQRQRTEEEMLTLMEQIEALSQQLQTLEVGRQARERDLDEHLEEFRTQTRTLSAEIESLRKQREVATAEIDPELMRRYERLRSRKDGVAVAAVVKGICEGCHVAVPEAKLNEVLEGDRIVTCEGCGRILYAEG